MKRRIYSYRDEQFILEPIYESVVRVTYMEQTGYVGLNRDWEADRPYTWINWEGDIDEDGISASFSYTYPVPELALEDLCRVLLREQRKQDSQRINPEERKEAGRQVFREFLEELPEAPVETETSGFLKGQEPESAAAALPEDGGSLRLLKERSQRMKERAEALLAPQTDTGQGEEPVRLIWGNHDPETNMFAKAELVNLLVSGNGEARTEARRRLNISEEDELLPFLKGCLTYHWDEIRTAAARALTHLGDDTVLFHFVDALEDREFSVRYEAERAILAFEDSRPIVQHIQSYMRNRGERAQPIRIASIEALEELGDERAVPFLIGAIYDQDRNVRTEAADSLGRLGSERAVPILLWALKRDESPRVVHAAGSALGRIGGDLSFEPLIEMMGYLDAGSYIAVVRALGEIGDRRAIAYIVEMLPDQPPGAMRASGRALKALDDGVLGAEFLSDLESADGYEKEVCRSGPGPAG